jgi:GTP-binding protein HflX
LFNALVKARTYSADQLFATLDTTTRQLYLEEAVRSISLSDTVGFIRDLPHKLVEAFEATLQEAADADLLLHVVDAASPALAEQMAEVQRVLASIGAADIPQILVYNKADLLPDGQQPRVAVDAITLDSASPVPRVFLSAAQGTGLDALRGLIAAQIENQTQSAPDGDIPANGEDDLNRPHSAPSYRIAESGLPRALLS